jgi:hypothetical protein
MNNISMMIDRIFSVLPFQALKEKCSNFLLKLLYILVCVLVCIALLAVGLLLVLIILWLGSIAIFKLYHFFNFYTL